MQENKRKLCVWVPEDLYKDVLEAGYDGPTFAVTEGLKLLTGTAKFGMSSFSDVMKSFYDRDEEIDSYDRDEEIDSYVHSLKNKKKVDPTLVPTLLAKNKELRKEVERLTEALQKAPDPLELAELRTNLTGLEKLSEEKDKRIEDLTKAVDMLSVFANYFKTLNQSK